MSVFMLLILLVSTIVYISVSRHLEKDFNQLLELRAKSIAGWNIDHQKTNNPESSAEKLLHERDYYFSVPLIVNKIADSIGVSSQFIRSILTEKTAYYSNDGVKYIGILHKSQTNAQSYIVISGAENYLEGNLNVFLFQLLLYTFIISLLLALFFSFVLSRYLFRPIIKITERVQQISSENLHLRLPTKIVNDEVNELANTFNQMLNRIETAFEIQNNFVSNASHELRTPLTTIIGEADLALAKERTNDAYRETITVILEEAENLDSKTRALLALAQTGFNGTVQKEDVLRIDQLVWDTKEIVEKLDKRHSITVNVSLLPENPKKLKVKGNYQLLQLALSNIITNASKYSNYQEVVVSIGASDRAVYLLINDSGIGIPTEELKFIYDPFFRASNTKSYEGFGIGLPLTKNIIELHRGEILVKSIVDQGTIVRINLPICILD